MSNHPEFKVQLAGFKINEQGGIEHIHSFNDNTEVDGYFVNVRIYQGWDDEPIIVEIAEIHMKDYITPSLCYSEARRIADEIAKLNDCEIVEEL